MTAEAARRVSTTAAAVLVTAVFSSCESGEGALARGDRLWADSSFEDALAEYRLAEQQSDADELALARVAHAYARAGEVAEAREGYDRLLARDPGYREQALFDFLMLGRQALDRGDRFALANAMEAALSIQSELPLPEFAAPLAHYYADRGLADRAAEFYRWAIAHARPDRAPELLYELGVLLADEGRCAEALSYLNGFEAQALAARRAARRARRPGDPRGRDPWVSLLAEARWHIGNCSFRIGAAAQDTGAVREALRHLNTVVELGVPENVQDQASFRRGEALLVLDELDAALAAFRRVVRLSPSRTGRFVERAQRRIDQIRFDPDALRVPLDTLPPVDSVGRRGSAGPPPGRVGAQGSGDRER